MSRAENRQWVLIAVAAVGLSAATLASAAPQSSQASLPSAIRDELTKAYPGWRFARVHPALVAEFVVDGPDRMSPEWVSGDYNGDRRTDFAVRIILPDTGDSTDLILGFLATRSGYERSLIEARRGEHLGHTLRTSRRGQRTRDYDSDDRGERLFVLRNDALNIVINEGAGITCVFESRRWRCFQSAD